ncbi:MAG: glycosyltransferase [Actinobacteria bacterium]|nr:glycosyltransferase [Actinomycetota bacterium]
MPAFESEASVGATVTALSTYVDDVLVIDDGSADGTARAALDAGASVLRLDRNQGKAAAVLAGVAARPDADVYLLADADLGTTAAALRPLLGPAESGAADLVIGALPSAGRRGGFGIARNLSAWGIQRATGWNPRAPLSGQRAVRGPLLRALIATSPTGDRFGLESAMSIDAMRNGARVLEIDVEAEHRHRGRSVGGFAHRGRQAADIARALWPRLTSPGLRVAIMVAAFVAAVVFAHLAARAAEPASTPLLGAADGSPRRVLMVGMPGVRVEDIRAMPNLSAMAADGAVGALTARTRTGFPSSVEGYSTLGAGSRVDAEAALALAFNAGEPLEGGVAREALARRTGDSPDGEVVVVGAPAAAAQAGDQVSSFPGALGSALHEAGLLTGVVGNADTSRPRLIEDPQLGPADPEEPVVPDVSRPAAASVMDFGGTVDLGRVDSGLLLADPAAPYGLRADPDRVLTAVSAALAEGADMVVVDPGDLDRARSFAERTTPLQAQRHRLAALEGLDGLLPALIDAAGPDALVVVVGVTPPRPDWHLTPVVLTGPGIEAGSLVHSASTRRPGVGTLTDVAPTVLDALGVERPAGMVGSPLRLASGHSGDAAANFADLEQTNRIAAYRERIYLGSTMSYIAFQAVLYLVAIWSFSRLKRRGRAATALKLGVLAVAAHPVGTFLHRGIPGVEDWGVPGIALLPVIALCIAAAALMVGRHRPLAPLGWIAATTIVVLAADVASGANLQTSSLLGYSYHSAGRFTGFGNTAFAILAATTVLAGAIHVHHAPRRREALVAAGLLFLFVAILDGSPALGSDVGGILTMVPVFGLTWLALAGKRLSWKTVVGAATLTAVALAVAVSYDVSRPPESRTHLGRLAAEIGSDGSTPLLEIIARKGGANLRTWGSPWVWGLAVLAIGLLTVLVVDRDWHRILPSTSASALRAGVAGTLAAGIIGYAVNDSGVVVAALILVYLGPFMTLVALDKSNPPAEVTDSRVERNLLRV